jgi:hypothetical protein
VSPSGLGLAFLLSRTFAIYRSHMPMILSLSGGVVAVVDLILGVGLGQLASGYRASPPLSERLVSTAAGLLVTTPLITAMLARAVLDVVAGEPPSARRSMRCGLDLFGPLLIAMVMFIAAVFAGVFALVIPAIYISVSWYFVAQAVVVDDRRGLAALARSGELVRGRWLRTAMVGLAFQLVAELFGALATLGFDAAARAADAGAVLVAGAILVQTVTLPFVAIGATLYYLDLRAAGRPAAARPAS